MANDETEFDKLLRETREWEARDRARHQSRSMEDHSSPTSRAPASPRPTVTVEELRGRTIKSIAAERTAAAGPAIKMVLKSALKNADAQRAAKGAKGSAWGWIWAILILFFIVRHFIH